MSERKTSPHVQRAVVLDSSEPGPRAATTFALLIGLVLVALLAVSLSRCTASGSAGGGSGTRSAEATSGEFPESGPPAPQVPPPPMLRDPKSAVYSYLLWISYAYRILDSNVASATFGEWEEVRVNSYVEMNRQKAQAIDQRLVGFAPGRVISSGNTATVSVREDWLYRYIAAPTGQYKSPTYSVSYDSTYTVSYIKGRGWVVDDVRATPVGAQPE